MFPSLLSHELASAHQDDLRREAAAGGRRPRHAPVVRPVLAAAVRRVASAVPRLRPLTPPRACVSC
jgi:hypothetical protein